MWANKETFFLKEYSERMLQFDEEDFSSPFWLEESWSVSPSSVHHQLKMSRVAGISLRPN